VGRYTKYIFATPPKQRLRREQKVTSAKISVISSHRINDFLSKLRLTFVCSSMKVSLGFQEAKVILFFVLLNLG
jgi:hypothetical protein